MDQTFPYDIFLNYHPADRDTVLSLAERLRADGLKVWFDLWETAPGDDPEAKTETGLEAARTMLLCVSAAAFGADWPRLETRTARFRDPVNTERRLVLLRLDKTTLKPEVEQFPAVVWTKDDSAYERMLELCRAPKQKSEPEKDATEPSLGKQVLKFEHKNFVNSAAWSADGRLALSASDDQTLRLWEMESGRCLRVLGGHTSIVWSVSFSPDGRLALSGSSDRTVRLWDVKSGLCLYVLKGHISTVKSVVFSPDGQLALSGSIDETLHLWDLESGHYRGALKGHNDIVNSVSFGPDRQLALSGSEDKTLRLWELENWRCLRIFKGHSGSVWSVSFSPDGRLALSGSSDQTLRLWEVKSGRCLRILEGHSEPVRSISFSPDGRLALSGSSDRTLRLWELESGRCLNVLEGHSNSVYNVAFSADGRSALSADSQGNMWMWDLSAFTTPVQTSSSDLQYTNAKVLLVGDTSAGKTGLAHRLATGEWKPSDGSTVGAWSTQWPLPEIATADGLEREVWLWDFGGQADQRLVHQLYMDNTALILLLFDADKENVLPGLREWQTALRRCVPAGTRQFLVAGRTDAGFRASREKLKKFAEEQGFWYVETSAKEGQGCAELRQAIIEGIPWNHLEKRTSPLIFKRIKDEILKLRDEGEVLHSFKELRELLRRRLPAEHAFTDDILRTVVGLLDGPGAVKELDYGTYVLLQPEWVNAYAQAVIRTLRQDPAELGCLPLRSIAEGQLLFQTVEHDGRITEMIRLPEKEERVVLREMEKQLEERGLCLRQGDKLVFPGHVGRDRPEIQEFPSVFVSYAVQGYLDDIYATLVVKLADCESFRLRELWRDAADFATLSGDHHLGIKLSRDSAGSGEISVFFGPGVTRQEQAIFANYIHAHLTQKSETVQRLRHYVCPHCHTPKGNSPALMRKLLEKKKAADVECDYCEKRFPLWDELEKLFADAAVRQQVEELQAGDALRLDARRQGKLLALEVAARLTAYDQKCFEIPGTEDEGIDMELEFTHEGKGTGKRLYLQLKSGNSFLTKRKSDGVEIFRIKEPRWVDYWLKQPSPVMLVIGTFPEDRERFGGRGDKLEFADVRWMEISSVLRRESEDGAKPVKQIEFRGERLDLVSVRRWRDRMLAE